MNEDKNSKASDPERKLPVINFWKEKKERDEAEAEKIKLLAKKETERISIMECPCCKSVKKTLFRQTENNGIMGSGFHSNVIQEYYVCGGCGIHYSDLNKR